VAVAGGAKQFQTQQGADRTTGGDHLRARQSRLGQDPVKGDFGQIGQEQKQPSELGPEVPGLKVELADVGGIGHGGADRSRTLLIASPWQSSEPFLLEDQRDGHGTEPVAFFGQGLADVIDGEVLFTKGDDLLANWIGLRRRLRPLGRGQEERADRVVAESMDQDPEASWRVAKSLGGLGTGESLDEKGSQGLVLPVGGVGWFQEEAGFLSYL